MNMSLEKKVNAFLARRPEYKIKHVRQIARACTEKGIPFCRKCDDWHFAAEECSA